jgi:hypothetical protein
MIWNHQAYGYGSGWEGRPYTGSNPHTDHVHAILGEGRGAGASKVALPTGTIIDPTGGSGTPLSSGGLSSSGSGGSGTGTRIPPTEKQLREANDRIQDRQAQLDNAQTRLDEYLAKRAAGETVKQSTIDTATTQRDKFQRELEEAKADLETLKQGKPGKDKKSKTGTGTEKEGWDSVGGMIFGGFMESMGFDGSVFKSLFEFPTVKSGVAGVNFGMALLSRALNPVEGDAGYSAEAAGMVQDLGLGGPGTGALAGLGDVTGLQFPEQHGESQGTPGPGNNGPVFNMPNAQLGVSPGAFDDKVGEMTAASKRYPTLAGN